jgi:hypothetical protein
LRNISQFAVQIQENGRTNEGRERCFDFDSTAGKTKKECAAMTIERYLRLLAGSFVMASVLLGVYHSTHWFLGAGFVALNRRGDLFRASHARLLSIPSAKMIRASASAFFIVVFVAATRDLD